MDEANEQENDVVPDDEPQPRFDWRQFRADLIASEHAAERVSDSSRVSSAADGQWAHQIVTPERGSLLVAKRKGMGIFSRAVILIVDHQESTGSLGLMINVPTQFKVDDTRLPEAMVAGEPQALVASWHSVLIPELPH